MIKLKIIVSDETSQFIQLLKENQTLFDAIDRNIYKKNCELFLSIEDKGFNAVKLYFKFTKKIFSVTYFVKSLDFVDFFLYKIQVQNWIFVKKLVEKK
jgi:DNA-directed RNA polymerase subunit L